MEALFWILLAGVVYAYAGYPSILWVLSFSGARPRPPVIANVDPASLPQVSIMVPSYNEAGILRERLDNLLSLRYPADRFEVIVGSDGSTDSTMSVAQSRREARVRAVSSPSRDGKTALLNRMIALSSADIVVLTDVNSRFEEDTLRHLVTPFSNPKVGCVTGELVYVNREEPVVRAGEGLYWRMENTVKEMESRFGGTLVATGAVYAMRRSLCLSLPTGASDDAANPLLVLAAGYEVVVERRARAFERAATSLREEFNRKARMVTRQLGAHARVCCFMKPFRPVLAARLVSHKLLRWLVPFFLLGALAINLTLLDRRLYQVTLGVAALGAMLCAAGMIALSRGTVVPLPIRSWVYFCVVNAAALRGVADFLLGRQRAVWTVSASTRQRTGDSGGR
jgi:cellulose synthase/poly-beta-1,6-N-acetylglucosamine synthase-like glycosyltransferase